MTVGGMAGSKLRLSQNQKLALTPVMRQSLAILQMSSERLEDLLRAEAADNPFIELVPARPGHLHAGDAATDLPARPAGMQADLAHQIAMMRLPPDVADAARLIAAELREDGYLDVSLGELAGESGVALAVLERGLEAIQRCEPAGIGARTLAECLSLQLEDRGIDRMLAVRIIAAIGDFAARNWTRLGAGLGLGRAELEALADVVATLRPVPVEPVPDTPVTRIADVVVERQGGGQLSVRLNAGAAHAIRVLPANTTILASADLRALSARADELAATLASRHETVLRVARHIVETQRRWFLETPRSLVPLLQREAAGQLSIHPSTLSRAIRDKWLEYEGQLMPLARFFPAALTGPEGSVSVFDVHHRIRTLIGHEDATSPLADEAIAAHLINEGVDISRRTVAKYRQWMRIPPSFARRRRRAGPGPSQR